MRKIVPKYAVWLFALVFVLAFEANAAQYKPIVLDSNYNHDKWVTATYDSRDSDTRFGPAAACGGRVRGAGEPHR